MTIDAIGALASIENVLRLAIREVLPSWSADVGDEKLATLRRKATEESKRRDGVFSSTDLLEYLETYELTDIVTKNWDAFKPIFDDKKRIDVLFGIVRDYRNTVAHSRELVPFEQALLAGIAGLLRSQVSMFRSHQESGARYYPLIESLTDSFNRPPLTFAYPSPEDILRVNVGDKVTFRGRAQGARGKLVRWFLDYSLRATSTHMSYGQFGTAIEVSQGDDVEFTVEFTRAHVGERTLIEIAVVGESEFHRHDGYDDKEAFWFAVSPPEHE